MTSFDPHGSGGEPESSASEERLRHLGKVAGELLHDLGNALAILSGRISLAREEAALGRVPMDELTRIGADADEIRQMTFDLLSDLRGVAPPREETFHVHATLESVANRWLAGAPPVSATLVSELPAHAEISGPRTFFSRAIGNLLRNAARHARAEIRVSAVPIGDGTRVCIHVEDDGGGISPELGPTVFEPLVSGGSGAGLGLSFARWAIERLHGTLVIEAEPGPLGGARFRVELPLSRLSPKASRSLGQGSPGGATASASMTKSFAGHSPAALDHVRVVLIDDDDDLRRTFVRLFRRAGAEVVALDPKEWISLSEAVARIRLAAPDVLLMDLDLHAFSGETLGRMIEAQAPGIGDRMVFFTGDPGPVGPTDHLVVSKLTPWDEVVRLVARVARVAR